MISDSFLYPTWIEIDLNQFKNNLLHIKQMIGNNLLCLPVKANAYGLGLIPIAKAALQAKVDYLAIACVQEAIALRQEKIDIPILLLGTFFKEQIEELIFNNVEVTIASQAKAELLNEFCKKLNKKCKVHIEVDTGMGRTGMKPDTTLSFLKNIKSFPFLRIKGIYSHFANADIPNHISTYEQYDKFQTLLNNIENKNRLIIHIANSGAIENYPDFLKSTDMVRPGILCFGHTSTHKKIKSCISLKSKISFFKVIKKGFKVSYGHTYTAQEDTRLVTVPIGYGDGYRRILSNKASVLIHGKRYNIVGNICMDQLMVDIKQDEAHVGDEVVLIGKQQNEEITLEEIAKLCNTIPYEILCNFTTSSRVYKKYID
jgi:alanine racemase